MAEARLSSVQRYSLRSFSRIIYFGSLIILLQPTACSYGLDRYTPGPSTSYTLDINSFVVETPSTAEVSSGVFRLKVNGNANLGGCTLAGSNTASTGDSTGDFDAIDSSTKYFSSFATPPSKAMVNSVSARIRRAGGPTGTMSVSLRSSTALTPSATVTATSAPVSIASASTDANGGLVTFTFSSAQPVSTTQYAFVLKADSGATLDGANNFAWMSTADFGGTACTNFPLYKFSTNSGSSWGDSNNISMLRPYFTYNVNTYAASGSGYWIVGGVANSTWSMSSFSLSENQSGESSGAVTYDVGVGSDSSSPTFTHTGLTASQLQALADMEGTYLYLRVHLSSASPYYDRAEVSAGSIGTL
jgi:hypothetical protein